MVPPVVGMVVGVVCLLDVNCTTSICRLRVVEARQRMGHGGMREGREGDVRYVMVRGVRSRCAKPRSGSLSASAWWIRQCCNATDVKSIAAEKGLIPQPDRDAYAPD